ncbi:methyltransferase-like protein 25 [Bradysia coprophila]|uniref:methyltransferase-like protein 25 n=1 Tax=Bradysia coprophila TaxID=38358 RepID=UPI00187DBDEF|nr:methyltransferase-like protein 25 [Bradysia coprophila]
MISTIGLQGTLDGIIKYLNPFSPLISCHMVNYITDGHWKTFIPQNIQNEIGTEENIAEALDVYWNHDSVSQEELSKFSNFVQFIEEGRKFSYDSLTHTWIDAVRFRDIMNVVGCSVDSAGYLKIKEFMSPKKNHEVEETAKLVSTLCTFRMQNDDRLVIIEAGDGKGYLSSRLSLEYKLKVLGIDSSPTNTENAIKRSARLEKAWNGLTKRAEDIENGIVPPRKGRRNYKSGGQSPSQSQVCHLAMENYKTSTHYITPQTDFVKLFDQHFPHENPTGFCLSGLHTCGNLASSCLRIFTENKDLNVLCNVGCCYHLLGEEFCVDEFFENRRVREIEIDSGFPMSNYLRNQEFKLGRNARMLGSQSIHRTKQEKDLPQISLFYRALLETLIADKYPEYKNRIQVGRSKRTTNFVDYVRVACKKGELNFDSITDDELLTLEKSLDHHRLQINLFYLVRMTFAPVIETLILLDRLLYVKENDISNSFLVKLFDPVVSPRCFAIVAMKT